MVYENGEFLSFKNPHFQKEAKFFFPIQLYWNTHVQLTFTKDSLQQNENYNLKLTKKKPIANTIKTLVVTKIK